ncbi:hypothetical protein [Pseudothauera rhizosphaerae]|uniref:Uncharacterized protein n=1 Tax=Pseudothauera rhizosphaerae TaxID=2565932 RepID=A0A4S4AAK9_9RHOO|nr:hypothetical protein [Pseudothauera rhizosphaerae]THF55912.1 hypothetical protein E6O51_20210 [Pseudothauera rhizosphaerae]
MKLLLIWILAASGATLTGCASTPSIPHTDSVPKADPLECVLRCPDPPPRSLPRELWEVEVLSWGLACRALHNDCVDGLLK